MPTRVILNLISSALVSFALVTSAAVLLGMHFNLYSLLTALVIFTTLFYIQMKLVKSKESILPMLVISFLSFFVGSFYASKLAGDQSLKLKKYNGEIPSVEIMKQMKYLELKVKHITNRSSHVCTKPHTFGPSKQRLAA